MEAEVTTQNDRVKVKDARGDRMGVQQLVASIILEIEFDMGQWRWKIEERTILSWNDERCNTNYWC